MASAKKTLSNTAPLQKAMICHQCKAEHYEYQLTCKRCNAYLNSDDAPAVDNHMMTTLWIVAVAGAIYAICLIMGIRIH